MTTDTTSGTRIPERHEIAEQDRWNLEAIYPAPEAWEEDFGRLDALLAPVLTLKGKLDGPAALAALFRAEDELYPIVEKLYSYAHHREDENTKDPANQARQQRMVSKYAQIGAQTAWIDPEILAHPLEDLERWRDAPELADFRRTMRVLIRRKPHVLGDREETLLSMAAEIFRVPSATFGYLTNADMTFPDVVDENGKPQPLSNGRYVTFLEKRDRATRRRGFEAMYDTYRSFENTLASTLGGSVKLHNYNAKIRGFDSALDAALHPDAVPANLYSTLIDSVHEALPTYYDYVELRREVLGIEDLDMWDQYVPIVPDFDIKVDWAQACEWVRESCAPLGAEYASGLEECFAGRWIDVYENKGKRSGAYSGGSYLTQPYVLMNYQGTLDWVFTLAHELGHSMHSWLANRAQPYRYADYTIFVAEIASTTNEGLLHEHLLARTDDPRFRAYLLNHLCDQFKGTVFRQTMFAEFERTIHEMDAAGEPLTAQSLGDAYEKLNAKYYGPAIDADARIRSEWSRIPHFYYNFYVYKYATGFCASQVFKRRILESGDQRDQYLDFLRSGGSADPLDLVRTGGVDLTDRKVLTDAFATFSAAVKELRGLLTG